MQMANRVRITTAGVAEGVWILTGTRTHQNWEKKGTFRNKIKTSLTYNLFVLSPTSFVVTSAAPVYYVHT